MAGRRSFDGRTAAVVLLVLLAVFAVTATGCGSKAEDSKASEATQSEASDQDTSSSESTEATSTGSQTPAPASGLQIEDKVVGTGAEAKPGNVVMVHYTGWLADGTQFDSSRDSGQPFQFTLGAGEVIPGWDQGVAGMKVGGVRKLTVPPELGYGPQGYPPVIPPNATLVFEVELLQVN